MGDSVQWFSGSYFGISRQQQQTTVLANKAIAAIATHCSATHSRLVRGKKGRERGNLPTLVVNPMPHEFRNFGSSSGVVNQSKAVASPSTVAAIAPATTIASYSPTWR